MEEFELHFNKILIISIIAPRRYWMDYGYRLSLLENSPTTWVATLVGRRALATVRQSGHFFLSRARSTFHIHSSLLCFFILFHSCCSHTQVFGKTLVHEFHISYSHTELYLLFRSMEAMKNWKPSAIKLIRLKYQLDTMHKKIKKITSVLIAPQKCQLKLTSAKRLLPMIPYDELL